MNKNDIASGSEAAFDLDQIEDLDRADVEIVHPISGEGLGVFITLAGPEHPDRKTITMQLIRKARSDAARAEAARQQALRSGRPIQAVEPSDPEQDSAESIEMLASITLGWYTKIDDTVLKFIRIGGKELVFGKQVALDLYLQPNRQWIVRQLLAAMHSANVFTRA